MERVCPTRNGLALSTHEIDLPPSRLNPDFPGSYNLHHLYWEKNRYKGDLISNTFRDLEYNQEIMLRDQHNMGRTALHTIYLPPPKPSIDIMMNRLDMAHETSERLRVWDEDQKRYIYHSITEICWKQLLMRYNERNAA